MGGWLTGSLFFMLGAILACVFWCGCNLAVIAARLGHIRQEVDAVADRDRTQRL
jgi:hypothetical protein